MILTDASQFTTVIAATTSAGTSILAVAHMDFIVILVVYGVVHLLKDRSEMDQSEEMMKVRRCIAKTIVTPSIIAQRCDHMYSLTITFE
jgi:hypothetical protein